MWGHVTFSPNGKKIALLRGSAVIGFWNFTLTQPKYIESASPHEQTPTMYDFHASQQHLFEGTYSAWIHYHNGQEQPKCVCWLPPERRGSFAYRGTKVCLGAWDGMITILDFSPVVLPQ
jgi:hypothetical protein